MPKQNRKKKNKETAPQIKTIRGVTSTGFAFEITKERLENYELLEAISEVDTNPAVLPKSSQTYAWQQIRRFEKSCANCGWNCSFRQDGSRN